MPWLLLIYPWRGAQVKFLVFMSMHFVVYPSSLDGHMLCMWRYLVTAAAGGAAGFLLHRMGRTGSRMRRWLMPLRHPPQPSPKKRSKA